MPKNAHVPAVHLPSGNRCDAGRHALNLCFVCGVTKGIAESECCPCRRCPCCVKRDKRTA